MTAQDQATVTERLRNAGSVFAADEARLLVEAAGNLSELELLVNRRSTGEPLEYVLGWAEFCGLRVRVTPGIFVPRRRTAFLVARAVAIAASHRHPLVIDVCCGSGAIAAALAARLGALDLYATDIDPAAVACTRENLGDACTVFEGDLFSPLPRELRGNVDVLVANAPYVPTADIATMPREARLHENRATLDGGHDGLDVHRRIIREAPEWLRPGGQLLIEISDLQAARTARIVTDAGLTSRIEHSSEFDATIVTGTR